VGAAVVQDRSGGQIGRIAEITAPALTVLTVILFMGAVSGAHLNPIVTVAFALRHDFHWRRVPGYILAQLLGALLAALLVRATFGDVAHLGATLPGSAPSPAPAPHLDTIHRHRRTPIHPPRDHHPGENTSRPRQAVTAYAGTRSTERGRGALARYTAPADNTTVAAPCDLT
jgi:hypothetical protein